MNPYPLPINFATCLSPVDLIDNFENSVRSYCLLSFGMFEDNDQPLPIVINGLDYYLNLHGITQDELYAAFDHYLYGRSSRTVQANPKAFTFAIALDKAFDESRKLMRSAKLNRVQISISDKRFDNLVSSFQELADRVFGVSTVSR